ncbi:MSHA biogenesis protein MshN [Vibrio clamense]|uniref:tetratricopeptide repeat protein n=1 Tax=Vibrio TaxID=662 RepID=UPI0014934726|nr:MULTISPECIES: MSHA biogenesis protein MshN [Vibrio]MDN3699394.1 MSHA biogenesis protein MshN [Vibrio cortegadensis]NOH83637.1 MSHA biogenesis protein MshN [Vibrio sp. 03-59-1]
MSAMNNALSELANKDQSLSAPIEKAQVNKVKSRSPIVWVALGFSLSLAVGGWAVSQQSDMIVTSENTVNLRDDSKSGKESDIRTLAEKKVADKKESDFTPVTPEKTIQAVTIFEPVNDEKKKSVSVSSQKPIHVAKINQPQSVESQSAKVQLVNSQIAERKSSQPTRAVKANESTKETNVKTAPTSAMVVEQVELTPEALAQNALSRAKKSLDSNDMNGALSNYSEVLRYTPKNEVARQKLAALYYGKGDARKAYDILQYGIKLSPDSEDLRLGLSKLLIKEKQPDVALSPLIHLPPNPSIRYLAMRAALGQKSKQSEVTLESYQQLVGLDPENGRWWLGLAIQQERNMDFDSAFNSYQQALSLIGISKQSQNFVRDRMKVLRTIQESTSAN